MDRADGRGGQFPVKVGEQLTSALGGWFVDEFGFEPSPGDFEHH